MMGERNGCANDLMSFLFNQTESSVPFIFVIFKGVTGKVSNSFNCPRIYCVTGKKELFSWLTGCCGTVTFFCLQLSIQQAVT